MLEIQSQIYLSLINPAVWDGLCFKFKHWEIVISSKVPVHLEQNWINIIPLWEEISHMFLKDKMNMTEIGIPVLFPIKLE